MSDENLNTALARAQSQMKAAVFNKSNPHYKSRYADLASIIEAAKPLAANGLSYTHTLHMENGVFFLRCTLRYVSGECVISDYPLPINAKPQELGSALTYGRRYTLSAVAGIAADEDDDANLAQTIKEAPKEDMTLISPAEVQDTADLMEAVGADVARALDYCKVTKLTELTVSKKNKLWGMLQMKNPEQFDKKLYLLMKMREQEGTA